MRTRTILALVLAVLVAACGGGEAGEGADGGTVSLPGEPRCISRGGDVEEAPDFVGLTEQEAIELAEQRGLQVREVGRDPQYGQRIVIEHDAGYESVYGHASQVFVAAGDRVEQNEVIALTGPAGPGGGPGLRFEVRRRGEALDPRTFVRQP